MKYFNNPETLLRLILSMKDGFASTLTIFFLTLLFSIPLGMAVALLRMNRRRIVSAPVALYILVMRGTPLMLQIFAIYFAIPMFFGKNLDRMTATIVAFSLNYAAYFAEIYRGGLESISVGQYEACKVLGMTKLQTNFKIVFPQVVKRITAPMGNEIITLVKDTSLANIIAISEIILTAKEFIKSGSLWPLLYTAVFYLTFTAIITLLLRYAEKKMSYYR